MRWTVKRRTIIHSVLSIIFVLAVIPGFAANVSLSVDSGHNGPVNAVAFSSDESLLFSGGDDGSIKIWNTDREKLVDSFQSTHLKIRKIIVNPAKPVIAILESDGTSIFRISSWNWQNHKRLFSLELNETPLYLEYSPKGTYLLYTKTDWNSLTFLDSSSGRVQPLIRQGFGIVSYLTVSATENTLMTYSPSGSISYWDLKSASLRQSFDTLSNLKAMSISPNKRYMSASDGKRLTYIDLTNGRTVAAEDLDGIIFTETNPESGDILCYSVGTAGRPVLSLWEYTGGRLRRKMFGPSEELPGINDIVFGSKGIFAARESGILASISIYTGYVSSFGANLLMPIEDLAFYDKSMFLSTNEAIFTFSSDFFSGIKKSGSSAGYFMPVRKENPFHTRSGLKALSADEVLLWTHDGQPGKFMRYFPALGEKGEIYDRLNYPLTALNVTGENIIVLEKDGTSRIINRLTYETEFEYSSLAIQSVEYLNSTLILGRNNIGQFGSPLVRIDTTTGETVPINDPDIMVFKLFYDKTQQRLFSLGLELRDGTQYTLLKVHRGNSLDRSTTLISFVGEDLGASMAFDEETSSLYTSLGMDGIRRWTGSGLTLFDKTDHIPRKLFIHNSCLYAVNSDNSLSLWDKTSGRHLGDFYLFSDFSWAAIMADGHFLSSDTAVQHISVTGNRVSADDDIKSFRVYLPEEKSQIAEPDNSSSNLPANRVMDYYLPF